MPQEIVQSSDGGGSAPARACWWPYTTYGQHSRRLYGGTYIVSLQSKGYCANFGAVVDDFGSLVRVSA